MKTVFLFPGQGAQYPTMGRDFNDQFKEAKEVFEQADDYLHENLSKIIFKGTADDLKHTVNSQLAIFLTSFAIYKTIISIYDMKDIFAYAGLSLGEYTALCAAEKIGFKEILLLIRKRALFMNDACRKEKGSMAAVLGLSKEDVIKVLDQPIYKNKVWAANFNTYDQTVISGVTDMLPSVSKDLSEAGAKRIVPLAVSGAFHSGLMQPAKPFLKKEVDNIDIIENNSRIVMNATGDFASDSEIKKNMVEQITSSVHWVETCEKFNKEDVLLYIEAGPGKTLTMMNRKNKIVGKSINIDKISDLEKLEIELR